MIFRLLVLVGLLGSVNVMAEVTIGLINLQKVLSTIKEGKDVNDKLKKSFDDKKATLTKEEEKIKKAQEEYMKQAALLSAEAKRKKEAELQQNIIALQKKTMEYQKEISELEASMKKPILDKVKDIVEAVSEESKVDFTVEVSTSPVVYAKTKKDLTDLVIAAYDKKHGKK
jgi:outer membrane protein